MCFVEFIITSRPDMILLARC